MAGNPLICASGVNLQGTLKMSAFYIGLYGPTPVATSGFVLVE